MFAIAKNINKRKEMLVVLFLVATFMSFALPRETFDPHLGIDYDIFCQLSSYMNVDPGSIGWVVAFSPPVPEPLHIDLREILVSVIPDSYAPIRAPPSRCLSPVAA